ncbi:MAG TPA: hypothetical protein VKA38_15705 [Draconibacterium sp.]|nr:hypothetical protein [Draconibacterium sp.]
MKAMFLIIALIIATSAFSQEKYLSISDSSTGKETVFKQNQRIRIKTIQGGKVNGKLQIVDDKQIMVGNMVVPILNIEKIKHNPLLLNVLVSGTLFILGVYGVLGGLVFLAWNGEVIGAIALFAGGVATFTAGILSPNFLPAAKILGNNKIKVKTLME